MQSIGLVFTLSILTEAIIEYLGTPLPSRVKPYAAACLSIIVCVLYNADFLAILGYSAVVPYIGPVLTGLLIGRGSNYVNDIISRLQIVDSPATTVDLAKTTPASPVTPVVPAPTMGGQS